MIYLDGRVLDGSTAPFDLTDRGLTLGDGLFDTLTAFGGLAWRRADHLDRLLAGCRELRIPVARERLDAALDALLPLAPAAGATIRLTVTRGPGARGVKAPTEPRPTVMASLSPWSDDLVLRPVRLAVAAARRNDRSPLSRLKTLGYLDQVLALEIAAERGFDDALFLNTAGRIASTTMANVFVLRAGRLLTPPLADGVLAGVVRGRVLALAPGLGFDAAEGSLTRDDIELAEAVFLTNSVRLVTPVVAVEARPIPASLERARPILQALAAEIAADCGTSPLAARD